jgi:small-conductance mechanosensitive channel
MERILGARGDALMSGGLVAGAVVLALIGHAVLFRILDKVVKRTASAVQAAVIRHTRGPTRAGFLLVALLLVLPLMPLAPRLSASAEHAVTLVLIGALAWLGVALTQLLDGPVPADDGAGLRDDPTARRFQTRVRLIRRIAFLVIGLVTVGVTLMTFPGVRHLGTSLLASAGLVGLLAGMAARPVLTNVLAGVQIALSQPMRIEDVVVVEGEWGWIEEIYMTYVVVRIWDLRRLVVPLSYFIEHPFQNWTRRTTNLLATVFLYADYTVPVEEVRRELHEILLASGMWDGKVWGLQVTDATEHSVQLRALMSAQDAANAWNLRCYAREQLIACLRSRYPRSLPRTREISEKNVDPGASVLPDAGELESALHPHAASARGGDA